MPATIYTDNGPASRGVSKLSRALSKLNLRSPTETEFCPRTEKLKSPKPLRPNARTVVAQVCIPPGLSNSRLRDYIHSTTVTRTGKAFPPQYSEVIPGRLFITDHFTGTDTSTLERLHITHVVSIVNTQDHDCPLLPIIDRHVLVVPSDVHQARYLVATIDDTVDFMDGALRQEGSRVLVHCRIGVQWGPTMVIAWLMRNEHYGYEEALETVRWKREVVNPGLDLEKGVKEWLALETARPLFPPGRGGRYHFPSLPPVSSPSHKLDFGGELHQDDGDVLDIRRYS